MATTASAQNYFAGATLSVGNLDFNGTFTGDVGSTQDISVLGGVRFDLDGGSTEGIFAGAEMEVTSGNGYDANTSESVEDSQLTTRAELHLGYQLDGYAVYGFVGVRSNPMNREYEYGESNLSIFGIGADIDINDNLAIRVEAEMTSMFIDACGTYDA